MARGISGSSYGARTEGSPNRQPSPPLSEQPNRGVNARPPLTPGMMWENPRGSDAITSEGIHVSTVQRVHTVNRPPLSEQAGRGVNAKAPPAIGPLQQYPGADPGYSVQPTTPTVSPNISPQFGSAGSGDTGSPGRLTISDIPRVARMVLGPPYDMAVDLTKRVANE